MIGGVSSSSNHLRSSELVTTKVTCVSTSNIDEVTNKASSVVDVDASLMQGVVSSSPDHERPSVEKICKKSDDIDVKMGKKSCSFTERPDEFVNDVEINDMTISKCIVDSDIDLEKSMKMF